jgi:hypothetical protein
MRVAVLTSAVPLLEGFLHDRDLHRRIGIELVVVVRTHPSMRPADRLHDLRTAIARRARMTGRSRAAHLVEHFAWRALHRASASVSRIERAPGGIPGVSWIDARATDDPVALRALAAAAADVGVVFGGSPIPRQRLASIGIPLLNIHASDPSFCRGMPPVFWEVHAGLDSLTLTLHEIVARLDAGAVLAQRSVPIAWERSLVGTLRATRARMAHQVPMLLADGLGALAAGRATPRSVPPGPLRTLPTLGEILAAERRCRRRNRARG